MLRHPGANSEAVSPIKVESKAIPSNSLSVTAVGGAVPARARDS